MLCPSNVLYPHTVKFNSCPRFLDVCWLRCMLYQLQHTEVGQFCFTCLETMHTNLGVLYVLVDCAFCPSKCPSLFLVIIFASKSALSVISIVVQAFFLWVFAWNNFPSFSSQLFWALYLKYITCLFLFNTIQQSRSWCVFPRREKEL